MQKYRKKPIVVTAWHFMSYMDAPRIVEWINSNGGHSTYGQENDGPVRILIATNEGEMKASVGDFIIKEPFSTSDRKFYPCKPDIFAQTYEKEAGEML